MITFNGKKYAKNDAEMVDSLFQSGGTCAGFYKKIKSGYQIKDLQKQTFAFLHRKGFAVSATDTPEGVRYSFGLSSKDEKTLGLDNLRYSEQSDLINAIN